MHSYITATTAQNQQLFNQCGTKTIAGRNANINSEVAGANFSVLLDSKIIVNQPFDRLALNHNSVKARYMLEIAVPNYEPMQAAALNILNNQNHIETLVINDCHRQPGSSINKLCGQYQAKNGLLVDYDCDMIGRGSKIALLSFIFEHVEYDDKLSNTTGVLHSSYTS